MAFVDEFKEAVNNKEFRELFQKLVMNGIADAVAPGKPLNALITASAADPGEVKAAVEQLYNYGEGSAIVHNQTGNIAFEAILKALKKAGLYDGPLPGEPGWDKQA